MAVRNIPSGTQPVSGTVTVTPTGLFTVVPTGTFTVASTASSSSTTLTQVTVSNATTTTLLATNANRKMAIFYNGGANNVYIKFGVTASTTSYTFILSPNNYYEMVIPQYTGQIDAIAATSSTVINVTEY